MAKRRVVVTGMGIVTPLGNDVTTTWQAVKAGKSGVGQITRFDTAKMSTTIAAEVKDFDVLKTLSSKDARKYGEFVHFAVDAANQAFEDSGITITDSNASRVGVAVGAGIGGIGWIEHYHSVYLQGGSRKISPFFIPGAIVNMAPGVISMKYNLQGPNISIVTACTTGAHNIGSAARMIAYGDADVMLAGGTEMATSEMGIGGFIAARALSKRNGAPEKASRPWDKDRDGFVLGEGAGVLVLEDYEHAKQRDAKIYAELVGFGMSADAYHITAPQPDGKGFSLAMNNALQDAGINADDIDYVNAHGTSTPTGDIIEVTALKNVFGEHAYQLAVSSTKSMTGHTLGAAGSIEAIFSILAMRDNIAPPTINLDNPSDGCDLNFVAHKAQERNIHVVLSNSFGFGGTNGSLIFRSV